MQTTTHNGVGRHGNAMHGDTHHQPGHVLNTQNGVTHNGVAHNGVAHHGVAHNGMARNGVAHNGVGHNGTVHNGVAHNGVGHNGVGHDGVDHHGNGYHDKHAMNNHGKRDKAHETGLLTRCVPQSLKHSKIYKLWLRLTRILQFLSAVISLGIFSSRVYKVYRLVNSFKAQRGINGSSAAVEGILAAAVLYTIIATIMMCLLRGGGPKIIRWLFVLLDLIFVGLFIAVAVLTRPNGGSAGPRRCYGSRNAVVDGTGQNANERDQSCNLPWGTFILAIVST